MKTTTSCSTCGKNIETRIRSPAMIGIVIPAHNEEQYLAACLCAAHVAASHPRLDDEPVRIVVALDACTDASGRIARQHGATVTHLQAHNVGMARAQGARMLLDHGARWLAFTDADSTVWPDWLVAQLSIGADAVCGTVAVHDWSPHPPTVAAHFAQAYQDRDGHRHIHGANFGISATAYEQVGGFSALACHEDVALVEALLASGRQIAWSAQPRVTTSARIASHARGGFGDTLRAWA
jgi:glycosyltransferase involved in cell wall biosynthesis